MDLRTLEERTANLERKIGIAEETNQADKVPNQNVISALVDVNNKLSNSLKSREKIRESLAQLNDLRRFLDPNVADEALVSQQAKLKYIELLWPTIDERINQLEKLQTFVPILDSEHIKDAPSQFAKLAPLHVKQTKQIDDIRGHTKEVSDLIKLYNDLIMSVNRQFVYWDKCLSEYENRHQMF